MSTQPGRRITSPHPVAHGCLPTGSYRGRLDAPTPAFPFATSVLYEQRTCGAWLLLVVPV